MTKFEKILIIGILVLNLFNFKTVNAQEKERENPPKVEFDFSEMNKLEFPKQIGFVNDFENIFTEEQKTQLTKFLTYYQENSNREIAVITIDSIPKNIEFDQYSIKMSDNWKVGKDNDGNGLTIVLSKSLRKIRISTTDRTQYYYLSDEFCQKVIDEFMIPEFKKGEYYDGILLGLNELIKKWI